MRVVDARMLPDAGPELTAAVEAGTVFGRVRPQQKEAMVAALQSAGHVVAMTGDGVNDVLTLKRADIGIAMGSGSPATCAVAQLVLLETSSPPCRRRSAKAGGSSATSTGSHACS